MTAPAAGWYPDNTAPEQLRYWDGEQWTEQVKPSAAPPVVPPPSSGRLSLRDRLAANREESKERFAASRAASDEKRRARQEAAGNKREEARASAEVESERRQAASAEGARRASGIDWDLYHYVSFDGQQIGLSGLDDDRPNEYPLALKEVRLAKKELQAQKRLVTQEITEIRAAHRSKQAHRAPAIRGGGKVGQSVRAIQQVSKAHDRASTDDAVAPLEAKKFLMDRLVTGLDRLVVELERMIALSK